MSVNDFRFTCLLARATSSIECAFEVGWITRFLADSKRSHAVKTSDVRG